MELSEDERMELADRFVLQRHPERQKEIGRLWAEESERRLQSLAGRGRLKFWRGWTFAASQVSGASD
jgi:predicted secreted Zn-dependent protease